MITRRTFLAGLAATFGTGIALAGYAFGVEPLYRLAVTRYAIQPKDWPRGFSLKLALISDLHACKPIMPVQRIEEIVAVTNGLDVDAILLLGDYETSNTVLQQPLMPDEWAPILGQLKAPLGVHAVLGNHDFWDDPDARHARRTPVRGRVALEKAGVPVYENDVVRLEKNGQGFWLAGLADQLAFVKGVENGRMVFEGRDDLDGTLAKITDASPVILMAHEPDIFPKVPDRVALTVSGHTHGGQVRLFGYSPIVPSDFGNRFAYGHVRENDRDLIVSGGLGCSMLPVRLGVPPEVVVVELGGQA